MKNNKIINTILFVIAIYSVLSPLDILPDALPVIGHIDDLIALLFAIKEVYTRFHPKGTDQRLKEAPAVETND